MQFLGALGILGIIIAIGGGLAIEGCGGDGASFGLYIMEGVEWLVAVMISWWLICLVPFILLGLFLGAIFG